MTARAVLEYKNPGTKSLCLFGPNQEEANNFWDYNEGLISVV